MNKPNFRPIAPLDVDDDALERVNERLGVPTMIRSAANQRETVRLLSRSTMWTVSPSAAQTPARQPVIVDFPTPPFEEASVIIM